MKNNTGFRKTSEDPEHAWMWNDHPVKILGGTKTQIKEKKYDMTPGTQIVLVNSSYDTAKSMSDMEKLVFRDMLHTTGYYNREPKKG